MAYRNTAFLDEFNTDVVNKGQWYLANYTQKGSWNYASFKPYMVEADNGKFEFTLNDDDISGKRYTGSEVQTNHSYHYGRYEADIKASAESGVVTTFFTYGGSKLNEIDIELVGKRPNEMHIAYHRDEGKWEHDVKLPFNTTTGFHNYAIEWAPNSIKWFADDKLVFKVENPSGSMPSIPNEPIHLVMNLWTGIPSWLGTADFTETKAYYDNVKFTPLKDLGSGGGTDGGGTDGGSTDGGGSTSSVLKAYLVDASDDQIITEIRDGMTIDKSNAGASQFSILVKSSNTSTQSIKFDLNGEVDHTQVENAVPYAVFGDRDNNLHGRSFDSGSYSLELDAFSRDGAGGTRLASVNDLDFTIIA